MMGYGIHIAKVAFLCNIWITILPGMGVTNDLAASLFGFVAGSMLVIVASIIPPLLRRIDQNTIGQDDDLVYEPRGYNISTLVVYSLVRAGAITIGGYIGQQYLEINQFWIAMTVVLIMPPIMDTTLVRGIYRAVGTVLGVIVGFLLVWLFADNPIILLIVEMIALFLYVYTGKGYVYAVLVFFSSVFIVIQLGLTGVEMANFGGNERIIATVVGIVIAFVTLLILQPIVRRDSYAAEAITGQS
jgi:uncharacterized membrane protein YccC